MTQAKTHSAHRGDVQEIVNRAVATHIERQRIYTDAFNRDLETKLASGRGMVFNTAGGESFRAVLSGEFKRRWQRELGDTAWGLLASWVRACSPVFLHPVSMMRQLLDIVNQAVQVPLRVHFGLRA